MKIINKKFLLRVLIPIFIITIVIIGIKQLVPKSKAGATTINVTYKAGVGTGEDVTVTHQVYAKQTQGTYDYTDNKIVFLRNGETTSGGQTVNFDGGTTEYNEKTYDMVLTGWKLTAVTKNGTVLTEFIAPERENYSNPNDASKDIGTVYAQEGWYIVPNGVTSIEVTAVYGRAIYARSPYDTMYYDEYHIFYYGKNSDGTTSLDGTAIEKSSDDNYGTSEDDAVATLKRVYELIDEDENATVYDTAVVLCGDLYEVSYNTAGNSFVPTEGKTYEKYSSSWYGNSNSTKKPLSIMSVDKKYNFTQKNRAFDMDVYSSLRYDNVVLRILPTANIVDIHGNDATTTTYARRRQMNLSSEGITFEITETVEANSDGNVDFRYRRASKVIINSGRWTLMCNYGVNTFLLPKDSYMKIGGLAYINYVTTGIIDNSSLTVATMYNPITLNILGGNINTVYGSGRAVDGNVAGNVYIYIADGKITDVFGAAHGSVQKFELTDENLEILGLTDEESAVYEPEDGNVNITTYGGTIGNILGGGQFYTSYIYGDVALEINNTTITGTLNGGGKGGKVLGNANITINNSTISGDVFGGGRGLTDTISVRNLNSEKNQTQSSDINKAIEGFNELAVEYGEALWNEAPLKFPIYNEETKEVYTRRYHYLGLNSGSYYLSEYLIKASVTLAEISGNVELSINNSKVSGNVYGGGSIAVVENDVTVSVSNSTVSGTIYGGGDGASSLEAITLYKPISGTYTPPASGKQDSNTKIGTFYWISDEDILTYFKGIYDGVNKVIYNEDGTTTAFSTLGAEAQAVITKYGSQQLVYSADVEKLGKVNGNIILNVSNSTAKEVFGGGNLGRVQENIEVNVSNGTNITNVLYGGGRGTGQDYTTVYGSSEVTISGIETKVENYGSVTLGAVSGDVNVNFNDYWTGNTTAKYKTMNGIDRATTVTFNNSYVLLENKDSEGNLEGIKSIENLNIPVGSGLKISAAGEITGNFNGGGELYLDSAVCLTVGGDISGSTKLVLNPTIFTEDNISTILGGIENPYLIVKGTSLTTESEAEAQELKSGDIRYTILAKKQVENGTTYSYYYISETITITNYINVNSISDKDRIFEGTLGTDKIIILNNGSFTSDIDLHYELLATTTNTNKYKNLTREFVIKVNGQESRQKVTIPAGTEIVMKYGNKYYTYIVEQDTTNIPLSKFKDEALNSYSGGFADLRTLDDAQTEYNPTTGTTAYKYDETYRFIVNFANSESYIQNGEYYPMLNINDNGSWISEEQTESATNVIEIKSREYSYSYNLDRDEYEGNGIINITGELNITAVTDVELETKTLSARLKFTDNLGNKILIPDGTIISINNQNYEVNAGVAQVKILDTLSKDAIIQDLNIKIDMSKVEDRNKLADGNYKLVLEFVTSKNSVLNTAVLLNSSIPFAIKNLEKENFGLKAEILNASSLDEDKLQLIKYGLGEERTINLTFAGTLNGEKVTVKVLERTGSFTYTETAKSKKIITKMNGSEITEITSLVDGQTQEIIATFGDDVQKGTYRIVFELYDKYNTKITETLVNFIVAE